MTGCTVCRHRTNSKSWNEVLGRCTSHSRRACQPCERLVEINRKIEDARLALEKLMDERATLGESLNEHHDAVTQRFPSELISSIFLHSLPFLPSTHIFDSDSDFDGETHMTAVFNISNVCRTWRTLARNIPSLWSILDIYLDRNNCKSSIPIVRDWVQRLGAVPLYVRLSADTIRGGLFKSCAHQILRSILVHAEHYRVFETNVSLAPYLDFDFENLILQCDFKCIENLRLLRSGGPPYVLRLKAAPTILTLSPNYAGRVSVRWDRLIKFTSTDGCLDMLECLQLFQNAPSLVSCSIESLSSLSHEDALRLTQQEMHINHTSLHALEFDGGVPKEFWTFVSFPNLKVLRISYFNNQDDGNTFEAFQKRCGCSITSLCLGNVEHPCFFRPTAALKAIRSVPDAEHLTLKSSVLHSSLFEEMNIAAGRRPEASTFFHQLSSLQCFPSGFIGSCWPSLLDFLATMTTGPDHSLRTVQICSNQILRSQVYHVADKSMFGRLMDTVQGLDFSMTDSAGTDLVDETRKYYNFV